MTRSWSRLVGRVVLAGVTVVAGVQLILYIVWWEWVRASLAGVVFVACLVVAAAVVILDRIERLERRIREVGATARPRNEIAEPDAPSVLEPAPDFRWLEAVKPTPTYVFVPLLLGLGVLVTLVSNVVERIARATQSRRYAAAGPVPEPSTPRSQLGRVLAVVLVGAVAALGLFQVSHFWPEPYRSGTTTFAVQVATKSIPEPDPGGAVEAVARHCVMYTRIGITFERVVPLSRTNARLVVSPRLGEAAQRRYVGCLEDLVLDRHQLRVRSTDVLRAEGASVQGVASTENR